MLRLNSLSIAIASSLGGKTFGVTLSSVTGGLPTSGTGIVTIRQIPPPSAITPVIEVSRSTGVAPLAVTFDALGTTAPALTSLPFSEIYYAWTFGDTAGGATWAYGTNPGVALKNEANGPVAAHVFETDGSYTVTCWAFYLDSGGVLRSGSATTSITVTNADTVFSGTNTICISQNSLPVQGVNGVPATAAVQQVPNWSTIQTLAQTYKRILLKRGDTWDVNSGVDFNGSNAGPGIIGAYGTGDKPIVTMNIDGNVLGFPTGVNDWRVMDLDITSNGLTYYSTSRAINVPGGNNILLLRMDIEKVGRFMVYGGATTTTGQGLYIADSVLGPTGRTSPATPVICLYTEGGGRLGVLGSRITGSNDHGIRAQGTALSVISNCDVDGTRSGSHPITVRGVPVSVPSVWEGRWTENVVVSDNYVNDSVGGSLAGITCKPVNAQNYEVLRNVLVERNRIAMQQSEGIFAQVVTGFAARNNLITTGYGIGIGTGAVTDVGAPLPSEGFIYNNTLYKGNTTYSTSFGAVEMRSGMTGQVVKNNLAYAPGSTSPTMFMGTGVEGVAYTQSNNSSPAQILSTLPFVSASPVVAADFAPAGYAVDGGAWVPVYKNYLGTTNSTPREIGAI